MKGKNKSRKYIIGVLVAIGIVAILATVGNAKGATINVPGDYSTIQDAIDAASDGDTIIVGNGTYNEQVIINKNNLSIQSEYGAANTIINATGQGTSYGGVVFDADGCTFEGFTVMDYSNESYENKIIRINGNNNTIKNNIIQGNLNQPVSDQTEYGILFQSTASGNLIENNEVYDIGYIGINIYGGEAAHNNTIRNNYVHDIGIYAITVDRSPNNTVTQNTISNLVGGTLWGTYYDPNTYCWGIVVWGANSAGTLITQQNITNLPNGIVLSSAQNVTIGNCNISNNDNYGIRISYTGWVGDRPENNTIVNNSICNNKVGIYITSGTGSIGPFNIIHYNNIYGNIEMGLNNTSPTLIDAEYNYWGDATGPYYANGNHGSGDNVSDNVDYCPWLDAPYPGGSAVSGIQNTNTGEYFCTIQDAIDAASDGDTIVVHDGVYTEQLIINKPLTLMAGSSPLLDFSGYSGSTKHIVDAQGAHDEVAGIYVNASDVTIDGFHFIGIAPDNMSNQLDSGLNTVIRAYTTADNLTVQNCVFDPPTGSVGRVAITVKWADNLRFLNNEINDYIYGVNLVDAGDSIDNALVQGNTFTQTQYVPGYASGMWFDFCEGVQLWLGDNLQVINNTFTGPGTSTGTGNLPSMVAVLDFNNYFDSGGTKTIKVENNTIENYYDGVDTCSNGIIEGNTISNNAIGVYVEDVSGIAPTINYNNIEGNSQYGVINDHTAVTLDAEYNYWGDATGPYYANGNHGSGDNVSDNVDYCPWLDAPYPGGSAVSGIQNTNTGEYFCTIQDAIDAASDGDTIVVHDGVYEESLTIDKSINLISGSNPIIKCPSSPEDVYIQESTHHFEYVIAVLGGTYNSTNDTVYGSGTIHVNISGFEINGSNAGTGTSHYFAGIFIRNAVGNISNNYIHDMYGPSGDGSGEQTFGILAYGNSDLTVYGNTIEDFSRGGIVANGDLGALPDPVANIQNNIVMGNGLESATGWWAENGIQIGYEATGTVKENEVYDCMYNDGWASSGIIVAGTVDVIVEDNDVHGNDGGITTVGYEDYKNAPCYNITIKNNQVYSIRCLTGYSCYQVLSQ